MIPFMLFLWWFGLRKVKQAHNHLIQHLYAQKKYKCREKSSTSLGIFYGVLYKKRRLRHSTKKEAHNQ